MQHSYFKQWAAYRKSFLLARAISRLTREWPQRERNRLGDQIIRSSRAVGSNLAESFAKRRYARHFIAKITDAAGENYETQHWVCVALDEQLIDRESFIRLTSQSEEVGRLLSWMIANVEKFKPINS